MCYDHQFVLTAEKNSRKKEIILAPFRKNLCANLKNFWRDLLQTFRAKFSAFSALKFKGYTSSLSRQH